LQKKAIGSEAIIEGRPADLLDDEMKKLESEVGELASNEEAVLTYAMFPDLGREYLQQRQDGTLTPEPLLPKNSDISNEVVKQGTPTEFNVDVHGETYEIAVTGVGDAGDGKRKIYLSIDGMPEVALYEPLNEYQSDGGRLRKQASEPGHVTAAMPGNVVEVLVSEGQTVEAGQGVLVTEAMKMENEIQANITGVVKSVHVVKGDRVTPGEVLIEIVEAP